MTLMAFGMNYQTADLPLREKLALDPLRSENLVQNLLKTNLVEEVLVLSTCNRMELYCHVPIHTKQNNPQNNTQDLLHFLSQALNITYSEIAHCSYSYYEELAVRHLMSVASGLNSMVLGEVEILGQMKSAFRLAQNLGTIGKYLGRLFQTTFSVAKQVRSETGINLNPMSVGSIAVKLAERIFTDIKQATVLLVGAGDLIRLTANHLKRAGVHDIRIANRSPHKALQLAKTLDAKAIKLEQIGDELSDCDIVITGTGASLPLIGKGMVERALKKRKGPAIFMIDLAMPRDIEPEVSDLESVYLYNLEDIQNIVLENRQKREQEIQAAENIILKEAHAFMQWRHAQGSLALTTLKAFRNKFETERDQVLIQGLQNLKLGKCPEMVLQQAIHHMTNRLLHTPTKRLRQAGYQDEEGLLKTTQELFELI